MAGTWFVIALVAVASVASTTEAATSHVVGGSAGWTIPTSGSTYSQWLSSQKFVVGDSLVFNFPTGAHSVVEVPKSSFDSCSANNQIGPNITTGPATVTLTSPGKHYYICGFPGHCAGGQKLAIVVTSGSSASTPASAPVAGGRATTPAATPSASAAPKSSNAAGGPAATPSTSAAPRSSNAAGGPATTPKTPSTSSSGPTGSDAGGNRFPTAASGPAGDGPSSSAPVSVVASSSYLMAALLAGAGALLM